MLIRPYQKKKKKHVDLTIISLDIFCIFLLHFLRYYVNKQIRLRKIFFQKTFSILERLQSV